MKSLLRNGIYSVLYNLINVIFPLLTSIYVARILSAEGVGKVAYAQNIASYFVVISSLGLPSYGVRVIAKNRDNKEKLNNSFSELVIINMGATTVSFILYILLISNIDEMKEQLMLHFCCGLQILLNYINIDWFYKGIEEYRYIAIRNVAVKILSFILLVILVKDKNDYIVYALINSLGIGANYIFNIAKVRKYIKFSFARLDYKQHFKPLLILGISIFLSTIYNKIDITMMGSLSTNIEIGYYSYSHKIVLLVITICCSLTSVYLPRLSYYYKSDIEKFYRTISQGIRIIFFIGLPATVGFYLLSPQIIFCMYGQEFMPAVDITRVFSMMILVRGVGDLLCYQLAICTGNEKKQLPVYIIASILNVFLNYIFIPIFHGMGAAIASLASELMVNGYQIFVLHRTVKYTVPTGSILKSLFAALCMGGVVYIIVCVGGTEIFTLTLGVTVGVLIYFAISVVIHNKILLSLFDRIKDIYIIQNRRK